MPKRLLDKNHPIWFILFLAVIWVMFLGVEIGNAKSVDSDEFWKVVQFTLLQGGAAWATFRKLYGGGSDDGVEGSDRDGGEDSSS